MYKNIVSVTRALEFKLIFIQNSVRLLVIEKWLYSHFFAFQQIVEILYEIHNAASGIMRADFHNLRTKFIWISFRIIKKLRTTDEELVKFDCIIH